MPLEVKTSRDKSTRVGVSPREFVARGTEWTAGFVAVFIVSALAIPSIHAAEEHWVDDPRPLAKGIEILEQECRCVITYEDPLWSASDVRDVTAQVRRNPGIRVFVPNGHPFGFLHEALPADHGPEGLLPTVQALVDAFHQSGNSGRFRIDRGDAVLHVVPEKGSILDVLVSMPESEGSADQMVYALMDVVAKVANVQLGVDGIVSPSGHLAQSTIRMSANKEPAQQVLTRILVATGRQITWDLFYDYTLKRYYLNLLFADPARCESPGNCDLGDTLNAISIRNRSN